MSKMLNALRISDRCSFFDWSQFRPPFVVQRAWNILNDMKSYIIAVLASISTISIIGVRSENCWCAADHPESKRTIELLTHHT